MATPNRAIPQPSDEGTDGFWIQKMEIRHWISGKMMRRHDGLPFRIFIPNKRRRK